MPDSAQRWSKWASISTVVVAMIAAVTFAWGAKTELDAARAQAHATALEIMQAQLQLAVQFPELAAPPRMIAPRWTIRATSGSP